MTEKENVVKVLIVGAGAMGLTLGHHLQLAGAKISFLVRPSRAPELARPQVLYSYDDSTLKILADFEVITESGAAASLAPNYIIVTLDGAGTTSVDGTALLKALGDAVRPTKAVIVGGGVGLGLREHYLETTGLAADRVLMVALGYFAYQVSRISLPLHPPTDAALLAQADVAYSYPNKTGLLIQNTSPAVARRLASLFNGAHDKVRSNVLERHIYDMVMTAPFAILAGSEVLGWPPVTELPKHKEIWKITVDAVREIARLDQYGWRGKAAAPLLTPRLVAKGWASLEKGTLPMDFQAFNSFHHGAKVAAQDDDIRQACVDAGDREGKPMTALRELIKRQGIARRER